MPMKGIFETIKERGQWSSTQSSLEERKLARSNQPIMRVVIDDVLDVSDTFEW
jgi:hypothetical protein